MSNTDRKGFEWWDKFCVLPRYSFWLTEKDGISSVSRVPDKTGLWLECHEVEEIIGDAQSEINILKNEVRALRQRLSIKSV